MAAIDRLGLNDNLIELDAQGYTIVRGVLSEDQVERARAAILKRVEVRLGKPVDPDRATDEDFQSPMGTSLDLVGYILYDDEVFEEILMAEKPLALVSYLVGESCLVSSINYAPTPYSREGGATAIVPGSHRRARQPSFGHPREPGPLLRAASRRRTGTSPG